MSTSMPVEVQDWLATFEAILWGRRWTDGFARLVQLGVQAGSACDCEERDLEDPILWWLHRYHHRYDWAIARAVQAVPGAQRGLLQAARRDLRSSSRPAGDLPALVGFGKICLHQYNKDVLVPFLSHWCGYTTWDEALRQEWCECSPGEWCEHSPEDKSG